MSFCLTSSLWACWIAGAADSLSFLLRLYHNNHLTSLCSIDHGIDHHTSNIYSSIYNPMHAIYPIPPGRVLPMLAVTSSSRAKVI